MSSEYDQSSLAETDSSPQTGLAKCADASIAAAVAREGFELQSAMKLARECPRNEIDAFQKMAKSCERPLFAEKAIYRFPRGNTMVCGPSINMAKTMAMYWGHMRYGYHVLSQTDDEVHISGYALDLETGTRCDMEDRFAKRIQRKAKGGKTLWLKPDERDLRELINRRAAFLMRNCVLALIPEDIKEEMMNKCGATMYAAAAGDIKQDRTTAIRRLVVAFADHGVTLAMLSTYLGHPVDQINEKELASLRQIWTSLRDGQATVSELFEHEQTPKQDAKDQRLPKASSVTLKSVSTSDEDLKQQIPEDPATKLRAQQMVEELAQKSTKPTEDDVIDVVPEPGEDWFGGKMEAPSS